MSREIANNPLADRLRTIMQAPRNATAADIARVLSQGPSDNGVRRPDDPPASSEVEVYTGHPDPEVRRPDYRESPQPGRSVDRAPDVRQPASRTPNDSHEAYVPRSRRTVELDGISPRMDADRTTGDRPSEPLFGGAARRGDVQSLGITNDGTGARVNCSDTVAPPTAKKRELSSGDQRTPTPEELGLVRWVRLVETPQAAQASDAEGARHGDGIDRGPIDTAGVPMHMEITMPGVPPDHLAHIISTVAGRLRELSTDNDSTLQTQRLTEVKDRLEATAAAGAVGRIVTVGARNDEELDRAIDCALRALPSNDQNWDVVPVVHGKMRDAIAAAPVPLDAIVPVREAVNDLALGRGGETNRFGVDPTYEFALVQELKPGETYMSIAEKLNVNDGTHRVVGDVKLGLNTLATHMLVAGGTGSGKSAFLRSLIVQARAHNALLRAQDPSIPELAVWVSDQKKGGPMSPFYHELADMAASADSVVQGITPEARALLATLPPEFSRITEIRPGERDAVRLHISLTDPEGGSRIEQIGTFITLLIASLGRDADPETVRMLRRYPTDGAIEAEVTPQHIDVSLWAKDDAPPTKVRLMADSIRRAVSRMYKDQKTRGDVGGWSEGEMMSFMTLLGGQLFDENVGHQLNHKAILGNGITVESLDHLINDPRMRRIITLANLLKLEKNVDAELAARGITGQAPSLRLLVIIDECDLFDDSPGGLMLAELLTRLRYKGIGIVAAMTTGVATLSGDAEANFKTKVFFRMQSPTDRHAAAEMCGVSEELFRFLVSREVMGIPGTGVIHLDGAKGPMAIRTYREPSVQPREGMIVKGDHLAVPDVAGNVYKDDIPARGLEYLKTEGGLRASFWIGLSVASILHGHGPIVFKGRLLDELREPLDVLYHRSSGLARAVSDAVDSRYPVMHVGKRREFAGRLARNILRQIAGKDTSNEIWADLALAAHHFTPVLDHLEEVGFLTAPPLLGDAVRPYTEALGVKKLTGMTAKEQLGTAERLKGGFMNTLHEVIVRAGSYEPADFHVAAALDAARQEVAEEIEAEAQAYAAQDKFSHLTPAAREILANSRQAHLEKEYAPHIEMRALKYIPTVSPEDRVIGVRHVGLLIIGAEDIDVAVQELRDGLARADRLGRPLTPHEDALLTDFVESVAMGGQGINVGLPDLVRELQQEIAHYYNNTQARDLSHFNPVYAADGVVFPENPTGFAKDQHAEVKELQERYNERPGNEYMRHVQFGDQIVHPQSVNGDYNEMDAIIAELLRLAPGLLNAVQRHVETMNDGPEELTYGALLARNDNRAVNWVAMLNELIYDPDLGVPPEAVREWEEAFGAYVSQVKDQTKETKERQAAAAAAAPGATATPLAGGGI